MPFLVYSSVSSASSTLRPLIRSSTRRAFCGETRTYISLAENSMFLPYLAAGAGLAAVSVAAFIEWPLNERVRLNSPSLWPTMFSVTYTGINFFPLCTASVCPTISGTTVERRDQVRSTFFSLREFMPSTRAIRKPSTNAPFLVERAIKLNPQTLSFRARRKILVLLARLLRSPVHNKLIRPLVIPRLVPARRLPPRRHRMPSARGLAFTAAVRMVHGVHRNAAIHRLPSQPARASRLADGDVLVIQISHLPDRRHAILRNLASLARRQLHQRVVRFLRHQLRRSARRAHHLRPLSRLQL